MLKTPIRGSSSLSSNSNGVQLVESVSDSRKRQSKRDEAIRRKIENDLNKKKKTVSSRPNRRKTTPGTVLSLRPSEPIICKPSTTVYQVSQLMSAKRENCVLVVNESNELKGIFTAKDLAFRVVGNALNANTVTVDQIMTPNPMCASANTAASEALNLMVQKGFRHLPVLDDDNSIVGVLDITKCYSQQMEKLERMNESSRKLHEALNSVNSELGSQPTEVLKYFSDLKSKMDGPTLDTVLDVSTIPVYINVKSSVYDATVLMKENRTTAVLVKDNNDDVTGIFTSKDVVLRVIAAGLDPKTCSVIRVMTPQPDVASKDMTIQRALKQMFEGHYLNLPVVEDNEIIGIVEVLKLTYATLNQIKNVQANSSGNDTSDSEGPAWNKFWTSLDNEDSESIHSESLIDGAPDVTQSEFQAFNVDNIKPSDSISYVNEEHQSVSKFSANDIIDLPYNFKFKTPLNRIHRVSLKPNEGVARLRELINSKFNRQESVKFGSNGTEYLISYVDDEGDVVAITSDQDLIDCVVINKKLNNEKADLFVHGHDEEISSPSGSEIVPGLANEVLIGGLVAGLAAVAIVAFVIKKN